MLPAFRGPISGMTAYQQMLDVIANNLANVSTPGFKASKVEFQELLYARAPVGGDATLAMLPAGGPGTSPRLTDVLGAGVRLGATSRSLEDGRILEDGDPLHAAIDGDGFFVVRLGDGSAGYTRDGSFGRDPLGRLTTENGDVVLPETLVPADARSVRIDPNGVIFARIGDEMGDDAEIQIGEIQLARFTNPEGLVAIGQNLFLASDASGPALVGYPGEEGYGGIRAGAVESSNVDLGEQMTSMLVGQRAYAFSARAMQTIDEMLSLANNLRR